MINNKWCLLCGILTIGLILALSTTATARDAELKNVLVMDEGATEGGQLSSGEGASSQNGNIVYSMNRGSGYFARPFPGYRDYDDIHADKAGGELISYSINVFGSTQSGNDAGSPFDVVMRLYEDRAGDPAIGVPNKDFIPGTECLFLGVPPGAAFSLLCKPAPGVTVSGDFWTSIEFSTDNAGWLISAVDAFKTGDPCDIGLSQDFYAEEDLFNPQVYTFFFFNGCNVPDRPFGCANFISTIIFEGQPWACCNPESNECVNVRETKCDCAKNIFTKGVLCNDLDPPCSKSGACCNKATGQCRNTFESECQGFADIFTRGASCSLVECVKPDNVPTVTQWGMIVLSVMLVAGLTIKFGRRRTATA